MNTVEAIKNVLKSWSKRKIIEAWNEYCDDNYYSDNIYPMYMLNDVFSDGSFTDILSRFDRFDTGDDYFTFDDATGLYNTISGIWEVVNIDDLATYLYNDIYDDDDIEDILREED